MSRSVLVTGAAHGIGLATARRFAREGWRVALADIDADACAARAGELGADHSHHTIDMTCEASVVALVAAVDELSSGLDVLVNNAGRIDARAVPALEQDAEDFRSLLAVNLAGTEVAAREAAARMARRGRGVIVNTASGAGVIAVPLRNAYAASKRAVIALTRRQARDWATNGVRVNAVAPGYIRTEMVDSLVRAGKVDLARVERRIPLGRLGRGDEIAALTCFLASGEAAGITGALCVADGGYMAFGGTGDASEPGCGHADVAPVGVRVVVLVGGAPLGLAERLRAEGDIVEVLDLGPASIAGVAARHGRLDVLVVATDEAVADSITAAFLAMREAARAMLGRHGGSVVAIVRSADPTSDPVAGGIEMLVRSLACEWASGGIRVNAVFAAAATSQVAGVVRFLASPDASYVTGATFPVGAAA